MPRSRNIHNTSHNERLTIFQGGQFIVNGLSMACCESRSVFLNALPKYLHSAGGGLIRYNPLNTLVKIKWDHSTVGMFQHEYSPEVKQDAADGTWPCDFINIDFQARYLTRAAVEHLYKSFPRLQNIVYVMDETARWCPSGVGQVQELMDDQQRKYPERPAIKVSLLTYDMNVCTTGQGERYIVEKFDRLGVRFNLDDVVAPIEEAATSLQTDRAPQAEEEL